MDEYITKSDAIFAACRVLDKFGGCSMGPFCPDSGCREVREVFENVPVADVKPVVRGKWLNEELVPDNIVGHVEAECSVCRVVRIVDNFCPNCGAKMDGGQHDA